MTVAAVIYVRDSRYELRKALTSVLSQTHPVDEIIILDASVDAGVVEYVDSLDDARIRLLKQESSDSSYEVRSLACQAVTADFVAYLDARDIWDDSHIEKMLDAAVDADLVISGYNQQISTAMGEWNGQQFRGLTTDVAGFLQYLDRPSATLIRTMAALSIENLRPEDLRVVILPDLLSTHWSKARGNVNWMERDFWTSYGDILEAKGLYTDAIIYMKNMYHQGLEVPDRTSRQNYLLMRTWLEKRLEGHSMADYLRDQGYERIAIYGAGRHGTILQEELMQATTEAQASSAQDVLEQLAWIDQNKAGTVYRELPVLAIADIPHFGREIDAIIVSPYADFENIKRSIRECYEGDIISLWDLVEAY